MTISIRSFSPSDADAWDNFCRGAFQATFLQTRRFLSYHGDRFIDRSLIIEKCGNWVGVFPAALNSSEETMVVSHPGITYGGILHKGELKGECMVEALSAIGSHYAKQGLLKLIYKAVPAFYHQVPAQDDLYALFRLGAKCIRYDLSSTIDLQNRQPVSERRRRCLKKAGKNGVFVTESIQFLPAFWEVLSHNLISKHGAKPVHSLSEIMVLSERFPTEIKCVCGVVNDEILAGTLLFVTPTCYHTQYIAASEKGYDLSVLDAVFEYCIKEAQLCGKRWFNFGISTEGNGQILNNGLYKFKSEFGGGGTVHEFFELNLLT